VKSVLTGPAACIEHRSGESALGCQTHYCRLRPANIPWRSAAVVRRVPGTPDIRSWLVGRRPLNGSSEGVPDCSDNFVYPVPEVDERIAGDDRAMAPGTPSGSKSSRLSPSSIAYGRSSRTGPILLTAPIGVASTDILRETRTGGMNDPP